MEFLTFIYLFYMFVSLYFLILFILTFVQNKREMSFEPIAKKKYFVSVLIPAYNEENSLKGTVEAVLNSDYENILEIIIINDGSKDNTKKIALELQKKYKNVKLFDKPNSGKADSLNQAIKIARGELIAVVDADSYPKNDAISKMVGFFNEKNVGAVTTRVIVRNPENFIQRLQAIEYKVIAFTRKLLGFLDAIYVTPGPLAIYQKKALQKIGGFDTKNMTEDIEATWHLSFEGYKIKMAFTPFVSTVSPDTFKKWFKQRLRWNIGGMQTIVKYRKYYFRKGMLGFFILPFFSLSLLLGTIGLGIFLYRLFRRFLFSYFSTLYSLGYGTSLLSFQDINLSPSILSFFGISLFLLGIFFTIFALKYANKATETKENLLSIIFYMLIYITLYPGVLITSLYKFITGKYSWR